MRLTKHFVLILTLLPLVLAGLCQAQAGFTDGVELTTIKAPWKLRILGQDLDITQAQAKPDEQSAYFMMTSESSKLNVSVFIEPVDKCKTGEECRDHVLGTGNTQWGKFQDLTKGKIKDFSYFEFYRPEVSGQPVKMLDMYGEYVDQGYWIDLHISKVLYTKADHALFEKLINSVNFIPRRVGQNGAFETVISNGEKAAVNWLGLWDNSKCRESYLGLSAITKGENTEKSWIDYCSKVTGALGKNRSRKLIAAAFTKSLPPKTDRPLAILAYHSAFANGPSVVEIVGLMLEKDGRWTVTNYIPQG